MRIFVDACSIEAFVEDGEFQITELFYPDQSLKRVELFSFGGNSFVNEAKFYNLEINPLNPFDEGTGIWRNSLGYH